MNTDIDAGLCGLEDGLNLLGIRLSDLELKKFEIYHRELLNWCEKVNLISERDRTKIVTRHFLDSLSAAEFIPLRGEPHRARVLDVGSGAGFPGIPIKIARPDIELDILEPRLKRVEFLNHLIKAIEVEAKIYRERVEDFKLKSYDVILSRSVGNLKWLTKVAAPILASDGRIVTYKGSRFSDEFKEVRGWNLIYRKQREFVAGTIVVLKKKY
ncbi:MAG: 16S rRNA (guanine(527)-N(7))-methyltransferase RsmG [bacterium]|nr:16S rRNA (guanine(527)-N(7))-methyltransferase RsmG [bacterium]